MISKKNLSKSKLKLKERKNPKEWLKVQDKTLIPPHRITKKKRKNETVKSNNFLKINI